MKIEIDYTDLWSKYVEELRKEYPGLNYLELIIHFPHETITLKQVEEDYPLCNRVPLRVFVEAK